MKVIIVDLSGLVEFHQSPPATTKALLSMVEASYWKNLTVYSEDGTKYRVEPEGNLPKFSRWDRLLAATIRLRVWDLQLKYTNIGSYRLTEVKATIAGMVQHDTNILSQFMPAEEILLELEAATTFEELAKLVQRMNDQQ